MRNLSLLTGLTATFMSAVGCSVSATDVDIKAAQDPNVNMSALKSYAWLGAVGVLNDPSGRWAPPDLDMGAELKFLIDRELRDRGFTIAANNPDVLIGFAVAVDMEALEALENRHSNLRELRNVPQGGLFIHMINATTGQAIWAGAASGEVLENPTPEEAQKRLEAVIKKVFAELG